MAPFHNAVKKIFNACPEPFISAVSYFSSYVEIQVHFPTPNTPKSAPSTQLKLRSHDGAYMDLSQGAETFYYQKSFQRFT